MTNNFRALCADLIEAVLSDDSHIDCTEIARRARAALGEADEPAVPQGREPAAVTGQPSDEELLDLLPQGNESGFWLPKGLPSDWVDGEFIAPPKAIIAFARAVLARWGNPVPPPAYGEVAELVKMLKGIAYWKLHGKPGDKPTPFDIRQAARLTRAAELLQRQAQQTLPQGLIPMEYVDADSSARIVSEPSEDGPGGCWVVRNSRHVNPCTEFPTAEAAWDALQRAQSLPSTVGPFDRIKFTCHLVPREQADG